MSGITLEEIKEKYSDCCLCGNCQNKVKVFGNGNPTAEIAVIGEAPGSQEVKSRIPFTGDAGQLLDQMLDSIGIKRKDIFATNTVLCRTNDKNRTPSLQERNNCKKRLFEELSAVKPKFLIMAGTPALQSIFGDNYGVTKYHGKWLTTLSYPARYCFSIYHPSWLLHSSSEEERTSKRMITWKDMKTFRDDLNSLREYIKT
jgi:DNA polymerase